MKKLITLLTGLSPATWIAIAAAVVMLLLVSTCTVNGIIHDLNQSKTDKIVAEDLQARDTASAKRLEDYKVAEAMKESLTNAVKDLPENTPSERRLALACQRLRNQGTPANKLPAACGPAKGSQAPAGSR